MSIGTFGFIGSVVGPCGSDRPVHQPEEMTIHQAAQTPTRSRTRAWVLSIVIVIVAAAAFGAGYALRQHAEGTPTSASVVRLASVRDGCDDWAASAAPPGPSDAWCSGMVEWMSGRMSRTMMGSGMWAGPDQMRAACRQWADDSPAQSGERASSTCDQMVSWMDSHSAGGGWGMWTMHNR